MLSCLSLRVFFLLWDRIFVVGIRDFVYSFQRLFISYQLFYFWVCRPPFFGHTTIVILGGRIRLGITRAVMISDAIKRCPEEGARSHKVACHAAHQLEDAVRQGEGGGELS